MMTKSRLLYLGLLCCAVALSASCMTMRDRLPKREYLVGVAYHHCPKCHSLNGGIYGKGPNKQFDGVEKRKCRHEWEEVTKERFMELATEFHNVDWAKETAIFWVGLPSQDEARVTSPSSSTATAAP